MLIDSKLFVMIKGGGMNVVMIMGSGLNVFYTLRVHFVFRVGF